ncbi:glycosyltransferase family 8 protein [Ligilactobacillus sp. LYQ135]
MIKQEIPVFFTVDNNFTPYLTVAIQSLIENADPNNNYHVYVIHRGLSAKNQQLLKSMETTNVKVDNRLIDIDLSIIQDREENYLKVDFFTRTIFYRLFLADMFPQYDKGIYIDADAVILSDLKKLYDVKLGDNLVAATEDNSIKYVEPVHVYIKDALGLPFKDYINSGMLIINMKAFREEHFTTHFLNLMKKYYFYCVAVDQDYLNEIANGRILYLDNKWNAMPKDHKYDDEEIKDPKIVHYNLFYKPWYFKGIMYEKYFWKYVDKCPCADYIKEQNAHTTDEKRKTEKAKFDKLFAKCYDIAKADNTFKHARENGEQIQLIKK